MKVFFDDDSFVKDLDKLVTSVDRWDKPLIVLPTQKDVNKAKVDYISDPNTCRITFITYDYFLSKKWIADGDFDHIDFCRVDQFLMTRSYGVKCGAMTVKRTIKKVEEKKGENE